MKSLKLASITALAAALVIAPAAFSDVSTPGISISANVANTCSIAADNLSFGAYTWESNSTAVMNLTVRCTAGALYSVALDNGLHNDAGQRKMSNGSAMLAYELFSDPGFATEWNATTTVGGTATGANETLPVYGRIYDGQSNVPASAGADFVDTVVATITFNP